MALKLDVMPNKVASNWNNYHIKQTTQWHATQVRITCWHSLKNPFRTVMTPKPMLATAD